MQPARELQPALPRACPADLGLAGRTPRPHKPTAQHPRLPPAALFLLRHNFDALSFLVSSLTAPGLLGGCFVSKGNVASSL